MAKDIRSVEAKEDASAAVAKPAPKAPATDGTAPSSDSYFTAVSRGFRMAKHASVLALMAFLLFSFTFLKNDITLENLRYLLKFISFTNTETSISAAKINYTSGENNRLELLGSDLCTLTNTVYALYDDRGNQIMTEDMSCKSPVLMTTDKFSLCYDLGGNTVKLFNTFTKLHEFTTEFSVTDAVISDSGAFAVATGSRDHHTAVTVYDSDFEPTVKIYRKNRLTALEMAPDGNELAIMTLGAKNGSYYSVIEVIIPGETSAKYTLELPALGYQMYRTDSGYAVIADSSIIFLDRELGIVNEVEHPSAIAMTEPAGKHFVALYLSGLISNSYHTVIYDLAGNTVYSGELEGRAVAVDHSENGDYIFVHTGNTVTRINLINKKIGRVEVEPEAIDMIVTATDKVLAAYKNYALTYELEGFTEHYYGTEPQPEPAE